MASYTEHLPNLGGISTTAPPNALFPSLSKYHTNVYYTYDRSSYPIAGSYSDILTFGRRMNGSGKGNTKFHSSSISFSGEGYLTHLISPVGPNSRRYKFNLTVDGKTYLIDTGLLDDRECAVFGGFKSGASGLTGERGVVQTTSDLDDSDIYFISPHDTLEIGMGIPFKQSVIIEKVEGSGTTTSQFTACCFINRATITEV